MNSRPTGLHADELQPIFLEVVAIITSLSRLYPAKHIIARRTARAGQEEVAPENGCRQSFPVEYHSR